MCGGRGGLCTGGYVWWPGGGVMCGGRGGLCVVAGGWGYVYSGNGSPIARMQYIITATVSHLFLGHVFSRDAIDDGSFFGSLPFLPLPLPLAFLLTTFGLQENGKTGHIH